MPTLSAEESVVFIYSTEKCRHSVQKSQWYLFIAQKSADTQCRRVSGMYSTEKCRHSVQKSQWYLFIAQKSADTQCRRVLFIAQKSAPTLCAEGRYSEHNQNGVLVDQQSELPIARETIHFDPTTVKTPFLAPFLRKKKKKAPAWRSGGNFQLKV